MSAQTRSSRFYAVPKDPAVVTPSDLELPQAWPDHIFRRLGAFLRFLRTLLFGGRSVVLPPNLPGGKTLPEYLLREFHRMPNGYYSHMLAEGWKPPRRRVSLSKGEKLWVLARYGLMP